MARYSSSNFIHKENKMKHVKFFEDFLVTEVNLNETRLERLNRSVSAVNEFLSQNLDSYKKTERQGSYALRTIIFYSFIGGIVC